MSNSAVILFSHGSRDPLWRAPIEAVQAELTRQQPQTLARCAYLELSEPFLPQVFGDLYQSGVRHFSIVPMFLGTGRHAREDLPALVAELRGTFADAHIQVQDAIGEDVRMTALMAQIAGEAA